MKVLIFAYACDPNRQSEPGLGWNISREIARRHEVTLVTREKNRAIFEKYLAEHPECPHVRTKFLYHDTNGFLRRFKDCIPFGTQLYFSHWLKTASSRFRAEIQCSDVVHQLTFCPFFVKPWGATYTDKYIWGPIGGGGGIDARFPKGFPVRGFGFKITEFIYKFLSWLAYSPFAWRFRRIRSRVAAITFKARAFSKGFPILKEQLMFVTNETGYDGDIRPRQYLMSKHPLRVVAVGRMIPHKGFEYSIGGFAGFISSGGDGRFDIFGDGPMRNELVKQAEMFGIKDKVFFHGNVPNAEVHQALDEADVFLHASFIEAAAWSILEAMIHGTPIVCQDRSGMADMVTDACGIKVIASSPKELTSSIAVALLRYFENPRLVEEHGKNCQARVRDAYSWKSVGDKIDEVYRKVAGA